MTIQIVGLMNQTPTVFKRLSLRVTKGNVAISQFVLSLSFFLFNIKGKIIIIIA